MTTTLKRAGEKIALALVLGTMSGVAQAIPIDSSGITATASSEFNTLAASNTLDGVIGYGADAAGMWLSAAGSVIDDQWIQWDLGSIYSLDSAHVWNYNQVTASSQANPIKTYRGIAQADIYYSTAAAPGDPEGTGDWMLFAEDAMFPEANGKDSNPGFDIDFGGIQARYVRFEIDSIFDPTLDSAPYDGLVGLTEIEFNGSPSSVPEPATVLLLGIGLVGLGIARRGASRAAPPTAA